MHRWHIDTYGFGRYDIFMDAIRKSICRYRGKCTGYPFGNHDLYRDGYKCRRL